MFAYRLTDDTELRLLEPRFAVDIFTLIDTNRARLQGWLDWVERTCSKDDSKAYCKLTLEQCARGKGLILGIWRHGRFAGTVGLEDINTFAGSAEIGYWLGEEFESRGLVTNSCRALIAHAFGTLGLNRLQIRVQPANARSRAVTHRLGFRHEGTLRQVGRILDTRIDLDVYSLLRDEWTEPSAEIAFAHPLTDNAELRMLLPHYAEEIFAVNDANRARLRPYMEWIDGTTSPEDSRGFIRRALQGMADGTEAHWGVWCRGCFAGILGTAGPIDRANQKAEFGYWISEEFQGRGLVTAASRALLAYLFGTLGLNRAELRIRTVNARSRAVAERLGFTLEGIQRQAAWHDGAAGDMACYGLLREEWEESP